MSSPRLYFLNDVTSAVRHNLEGLVAVNSHLVLLKSANVVMRKDRIQAIVSKNKVALISGGGSGHEPSHAGFVGEGLLTASVSGNIFASPTADEVLQAIKLVTRKSNRDKPGTETLLIVPNYTGDRLHFGSAKERANLEGYNVDLFIFGDDCVFCSKTEKAGRRGLAGVFFIHKIAGALAESGSNLKIIKKCLKSVTDRIASISISLGPCNVPGVGSSFTMPSGQLELGLGIHGERGSKRISFVPAHEAVTLLIDHLTNEDLDLARYFLPDRKTRIVLLFNDNGGLTTMEMNVIIKETVSQFTSRGFTIERTYSGRFVTSFDMVGVCISMMVVNDYILTLLDAPCSSVIISQGSTLPRKLNEPSEQIIESVSKSADSSMYMFDFNREEFSDDDDRRDDDSLRDYYDGLKQVKQQFIDCVSAACKAIVENETHLNKLDSESGDSDCGSTLAIGARKILSIIESGQLHGSFIQLSHIIESCMGGTSGALFSLFFTEASAIVNTIQSSNLVYRASVENWILIIRKSCNKMMHYSGAKPGDRTLVDTLICLVDALKKCSETSSTPLSNVIVEVKNSAESTATMTAKIGRASYVPKPEDQGPDPGAWAIYLIVEAILNTYIKSLENGNN